MANLREHRVVGNIVGRIVGAIIAGWLLPMIGGGILGAIINATIGAMMLLLEIGLVKRRRFCPELDGQLVHKPSLPTALAVART